MHIKPTKPVQEMNVSEAFSDMLESESLLKIFSKDRNISVVNKNLMRFTSPLINSILYDVPCCTSSMILIPDVSKAAVDHVLSIIISGFSDFNSVSIKQIQEVQETAKILQIDLTDLDYVKKSSIVDLVPEFNSMKDIAPIDNHKYNRTNVKIETKLPESNSKIDTTSAEEAEDNQTNVRIKSEMPELDESPEYSETFHVSVDTYNMKNEQNEKSESLPNNESLGLRIKCERNSVHYEPSDLDDHFELKEVNDKLCESQIYSKPALTQPKSEHECPSSLESVETGIKLEKSTRNTVVQSLSLAPFPPPMIFEPLPCIQNNENFISELYFHPSDTQSPSPQKESFPEDDVFKFKTKEIAHQPVSSPPKSQEPELQYIYKTFLHGKCGEMHNRVDDCSQALPHKICGKQHSYFKECDGSWKTIEKFEKVAMRWQTFKFNRRNTDYEISDEDMTAVGIISRSDPHLEFGPPKSNKLELQYVYEHFHHLKCGKTHRRVDLCDATPAHNVCGKRHSYARYCDGSWMTVEKFEMVAMKWPTTISMQNHKMMQKRKSDQFKTTGLEVPRRKRICSEINQSSSTMQKPYKEMSETEKMLNTCKDWNAGLCLNCKFGNRKRHRCSKMISDEEMGEIICWGIHKEVDHEAEYSDNDEKRKKRAMSNDREGTRGGVKESLY